MSEPGMSTGEIRERVKRLLPATCRSGAADLSRAQDTRLRSMPLEEWERARLEVALRLVRRYAGFVQRWGKGFPR
jgi:hypothetical protein